jgi:hypothetical protein
MKDEKGHGSESRGGGTEAQKDARTVQGIRNWLGIKPGGPKGGPGTKEATDATRRAFTQKYGATGGTMASRNAYSDRLNQVRMDAASKIASDADAARALAGGGAKSAPVDVHPAMSGGPRNAQGYRTTGTAYEGPRLGFGTPEGRLGFGTPGGRRLGSGR